MSSFDYIRKTYKVPAKRGMIVEVDGQYGHIIGGSEASLKIAFHVNGRVRKGYAHPTWRITYWVGGIPHRFGYDEDPQSDPDTQCIGGGQ